MMSTYDELIPEQCRSCLIAQGYADIVQIIREEKESIADQAMSDMPEQITSFILETTGATNYPEELPGRVCAELRKMSATALEREDEQLEKIQNFAQEMFEGCPGPVSLRAKLGNFVVSAKVCRSPKAPEGESIETVKVTRSPLV